MTTKNDMLIGESQQIGPLQVWPLKWEGLVPQSYQVPPFLEKLKFDEIEDEDGPTVDWIQVHNPTNEPFLIPSGWIIAADLWQERTVNSVEYIEAHSTVGISVSCVEKSRWRQEFNLPDGGRAPFSVIAAGWEFDSVAGYWKMNRETRQSKVWQQVSNQESRTGERPTNSLRQVMEEDSRASTIHQTILNLTKSKLRVHHEQNGILIALDGQPLVTEFFSIPRAIGQTVKQTLRAASFDAPSLESRPISRSEVEKFLNEIRGENRFEIDSEEWGSVFAGGTNLIDTRITCGLDERVMHLTALNRNHRVLLEV